MNIQAEVIHTGSFTPQATVLAGPSSLLKAGDAARITLLIPEADVVVYERLGDDLVLTLADGSKIRLEDFFRSDADGEPNLRFVDGGHVGGGDVHFADASFHNAPKGIVEPVISGQSQVGASAAVGLMALAGAVVGGAAVASSGDGKKSGGDGSSTGGGNTGSGTGGGTGDGNTGSGTGDGNSGGGNTGGGTSGGNTGGGTSGGNTGGGTSGGNTGGGTSGGNTGGGTSGG
uniref:BapA prefix-like domain-containing protein n=1 Tax=Chelativorans xinjiangense TaxID=2681485 RepID=UPI00135AC19F